MHKRHSNNYLVFRLKRGTYMSLTTENVKQVMYTNYRASWCTLGDRESNESWEFLNSFEVKVHNLLTFSNNNVIVIKKINIIHSYIKYHYIT